MTTNPISHKLDNTTKVRITALYQAGKSLPEIVQETGVRYSLVYFYTVSGGKMESPSPALRPVGCSKCETHPYIGGLCMACYFRQYRRLKK